MPRVEREVVVQAPADTVYQIWRNFENLPQIMSNIEEVRDIGVGRSHWRAKGPLGRNAEWDAMITSDEPGRAIAWRSIDTDESNVRTDGAVHFESLGDATRIHVELAYESGGVQEFLAQIFSNPEQQVEEDLARFAETIEQGGNYTRTTERIAGVNVPESEERAVESRYPANAYEPTDEPFTSKAEDTGIEAYPERAQPTAGKAAATGINAPDDAEITQTQHKRPPAIPREDSPEGPGHPEPGTMRPTTTSTPGGTLGAPTEAELKADPADESDKQDTRM